MPFIKPEYPLDVFVLAVIREVDALIRQMKLSYFVCGAVALDILLHHIHGIQTGRTTADVDFAVAVESWKQFYEIKDRLIETGGFVAAKKIEQRLYYRSGSGSADYPLDIIPFGKVETPPNSIKWPPDGNNVMSVIGYADVLTATVEIEVGKNVLVPVISLPGLALLKLFAWTERGTQNPKDATDLVTLLCNYHNAGNDDRLFGEELELLEAAGFDPPAASPQLLGKDIRRIAKAETLGLAIAILENPKQLYRLVTHMAPKLQHAQDPVEEAERLLDKFKTGLKGP